VTYSYLTAGAFSARLMPAGAIFDVAGSAMFPQDPHSLLAILNSSVARRLLAAINPTVNFQVGDLAQLPLPCSSDPTLAALARCAVDLQRSLDAHDETSPGFVAPEPWPTGAMERIRELQRLEAQIDAAVAPLYHMDDPAEPAMARAPDRAHLALDRVDLARRWISFAVGRLLGRWNHPRQIEVLALRPLDASRVVQIRHELQSLVGPAAADQIECCAGGIDALIAGPFYAWHVKLYRSRPIYWVLKNGDRVTLVLHDFATADVLSHFATIPQGWQRFIDDGIAVNLAPICQSLADVSLSAKLQETQRNLDEGRVAWSRTSAALRSPGANRGSAAARDQRRRRSPAPAARK
jgi:hypothetical protein